MVLLANGPEPGSREEGELARRIAAVHADAAAEMIQTLAGSAQERKWILDTMLRPKERGPR